MVDASRHDPARAVRARHVECRVRRAAGTALLLRQWQRRRRRGGWAAAPRTPSVGYGHCDGRRHRRRRRRLSSQQATSLSQELHLQPILSTDLVGTYSCHGIDASKAKINQDAAAIAYPLAGDQHAALFVVVDGHGRLGHDVTAEVQQ